MSSPKQIVVSGAYDDIRSRHLRFLEEASKAGELTVLLWPDEAIQALTGKPPKFPLAERTYFLNAVRHVRRAIPIAAKQDVNTLPALKDGQPEVWIDDDASANTARRAFCEKHGIDYRVLNADDLKGFPEPASSPSATGRKRVLVTGCYDWLHSGHVRFFEEASSHGDLHVVVGHDANIRLLKGEGRPLFPAAERRYMVSSICFVKQALVSTGHGWLDAEPEMQIFKPDIYAVNEDGDVPEKREYCEKHGLQYLVLKRTPAPGLPKRSSTDLRGF
jgi:cytidyltransferase-like protein